MNNEFLNYLLKKFLSTRILIGIAAVVSTVFRTLS